MKKFQFRAHRDKQIIEQTVFLGTMAQKLEEQKQMTLQQLIEQFKVEPTALMEAPNKSETKTSEPIIPTSNSDAAQFSARPMYSSSYNPMHERRKKAIQAIYQFLEDENLNKTLHELQEETRITVDKSLSDSGILLESLDLREAYYSAQTQTSINTQKYAEILQKKVKLDEKPCTNLLYKFHGIHKSNILCVDVFYFNNAMYIISGIASRSLMIVSCKDILKQSPSKSDAKKECASRIVSEMNGLSGPPLYIDIDPKYNQYAIVTCMDGSVYFIDLHSSIEQTNNWIHSVFKHHTKYVTIGRWSHSSKYLLTAGHDKKSTLYQFERKKAQNDKYEFSVSKLHQYEFDGCVEAISFLSDNEFVISVRNSVFLQYYKIESDTDSSSHFLPYLQCNVNAFGDQHCTYSIGDIQISNDGNFILAKTDKENVLLMIKGTEETLKRYYGSHSDAYSYTRCCFSNNDKYVYASHHNDYVIWDVATSKMVFRQRNAHQKTLRDMCIDKQSGLVITASFDKTIKIWAP